MEKDISNSIYNTSISGVKFSWTTLYSYHLRAVNCEVFVMTLLKLRPTFEPLQTDVLNPSKGYEITDKKRQGGFRI